MSEQTEILTENVKNTKEFLIKYNHSKLLKNPEHIDDVLTSVIGQFAIVLKPLTSQVDNIPDSSRPFVTDAFSLWTLRTTQFIQTKKLDTTRFEEIVRSQLLNEKNVSRIFQYTVDFWADGGSGLVNALRDMFTKLLRLLKIIYSNESLVALLSKWLDRVLDIPSTLKVQYYLIESLSDELDMYRVLEYKSNFIESSLSLMWSDSLSNPIGKCLTSLLINIFNIHYNKDESKISEWMVIWKNQVLNYLPQPKFSKSIEFYVLRPIFNLMPRQAFSLFMKDLFTNEPSQLLSLLKIGQELDIEEEPFHDDKLISMAVLEKLLQQDENKLPAFELLTFSVKKSKPIKGYIFELLKRNLSIFFVDTEVETRNYFASAFKHFILRVRDSCACLARDAKKLNKANKLPEEQKEKLNEVQIARDFLYWLLDFLKIQLCPGTQYQRNDLAFQILNIFIETGLDRSIAEKFLDKRNRREYPFSINLLDDDALIRLLIDNLTNSYDDIRKQAKYILLIAFQSDIDSVLYSKIDWQKLYSESKQQLSVFQTSDIGATIADFLFMTSFNKESFICRTERDIHFKILHFKDDFVAAVNDPVGGYFTALRSILAQYNFDINDPRLGELVKNSISLVEFQWETVKDVLCHDASDGILPQKYIDSEISDQQITSYAFRAIKEASGLLNTLLTRYPMADDKLVRIGNLLISQLLSIRHSGAFQSILPSLTVCCNRARKQYPKQIDVWLKEIINELDTKTQHITRRSGGIPFLITTILSTETKNDRSQLTYVFENLIRIASIPIVGFQDKIDVPQINAFNCMRAIFIESKLASHCLAYVPIALQLSLSSFTSDIWALRNCSIMLFTSLQNRIFGKVGKNMSAHLFFSKFPGVRDILLDLLENSNSNMTNNCLKSSAGIESIFLVLNLLLRLKPTPGYDGLDIFKKGVIQCLGNKNWKIRDMASRTIVALSKDHESDIIDLLKTCSQNNQNKLHGHLMAIKNMIVALNSDMPNWDHLPLTKTILEYDNILLFNNMSFITGHAYCDLLLELIDGSSDLVIQNSQFLFKLGNYFIENSIIHRVDGSKQLCLALVLKILLMYEKKESIMDLCRLGLNSSFFEVQDIAVKFILQENSKDILNGNNDILKDLNHLLYSDSTMVTIKKPILKAIQKTESKLDVDSLMELLSSTASEDLRLATIEALGTVVTQEAMESILNLALDLVKVDKPTNSRLSGLKCLTNMYTKISTIKILFHIHEMLTDDDEDVRDTAAFWLNKNILKLDSWENKMSSCITSHKVIMHMKSIYTQEEIYDLIWQQVRTYLDGLHELFLEIETTEEQLFEFEKDNQFRNEIHVFGNYINVLGTLDISNTQACEYIENLLSSLASYLANESVIDTPLGWVSNPEVFNRLIIFFSLVKTLAPNRSASIKRLVDNHNLHSFLVKYSDITILPA
ncbi:hypothetical protein TBLA_0B03040 [Henningerozyma blattae CBS 6284]|uniref:Uncharacterized protein n=1 Tax=Henningerozyma blattae (strain ATCC 34711 / CBS 6284 / DSM 70876 / NBRC 10599 / NRRL Y-10934 / UCD 77-7) TaxID=1071380 RepID=I2GYE4_HENB6|nr:hypothetical protein TBLA_0B03040 [Tetrapisispora blattae CBS 6284]CCH59146.1 hypothetical protein TBLA_0B03040 [Tetrapisispora blattae CBS 6284]